MERNIRKLPVYQVRVVALYRSPSISLTLFAVAHCPSATRLPNPAPQRHPLRDSREDPPPSLRFVPSAGVLVDGRWRQVDGRPNLGRAECEDTQSLSQGGEGEIVTKRRTTQNANVRAFQNHVAEPGAGGSFSNLIDASSALVDALIGLCTFPLTKDQANSLSMKKTFPSLYQLAPIRLMIPIQAALNVSLPSDASQMLTHKPFPDRLVVFHSA